MAQAPAHIVIRRTGANPYLVTCRTRGELTEAVNSALSDAGFSGRARRQINLARIWRSIQAARCAGRVFFKIEDTMTGSPLALFFTGVTAADVAGLDDD